jgi:hypothetical protein
MNIDLRFFLMTCCPCNFILRSQISQGGVAAKRAWPRLAEYFARFYLSRNLGCSLEVLAPTLATTPLFIRPPMEAQQLTVASSSGDQENTTSSTKEHCSNDRKKAPHSQSLTMPIEVVAEEEAGWRDFFDISPDEQAPHVIAPITATKGKTDRGEDVPSSDSEEDDEKDGNRHKPCPADENEDDSDFDDSAGGRTNHTDHASSLVNRNVSVNLASEQSQERKSIQKAVEAYFRKPVELKNIAHSLQPIRRDSEHNATSSNNNKRVKPNVRTRQALRKQATASASSIPMMEVDLVVLGKEKDDDDEAEYIVMDQDRDGVHDNGARARIEQEDDSSASAKLMLIRMVNKIPLLDGAEAQACGLVRGISSQSTVWESFGLEVSSSMGTGSSACQSTATSTGITHKVADAQWLHVPMFTLRDSLQVASFIQQGIHDPLYAKQQEDEYDDDQSNGSDYEGMHRHHKIQRFLPAHARLGNVLMIAHIHAHPSALPLPTLSKVRIAMA